VRQTNWQFSESFTATTSLLALDERPDAIFCASDWLAIGCYQALAVNGIGIPRICCWRAMMTRKSPSSSPRR
jgi:LacI family transcriptional regulator